MSCLDGCSTLGDIVKRITGLLNDADPHAPNTRWSRETLIDYINEGLCRVNARRPDAFADTVQLTLKPGALQQLPMAFASFNAIETSVDAKGNETPVQQVDERFAKIFSKKPCLSRDTRCEDPRAAAQAGLLDPCAAYAVKSFTKNAIDERSFRVEPPVPEGCSAVVTATVVRKPPRFCGADASKCLGIPCEFEAAVVEWALYRAYSMDIESAISARMAERHLEAFEIMMKGDYLQEQRYGSGYYRGHEGTGDAEFKRK